MKPRLLVILGPTATGKSDLAVFLAKKLDGEVISADSRQVYKGLDIGTGKITKDEMQGIPHHLLDVVEPIETFTVVKYVEQAAKAIDDILSRGKLPIICGGTGFYIEALVDGIILPDVGADDKLRAELADKTEDELLLILNKLDHERAQTIDGLNKRRIIRAIEIATALGSVPKLKKQNKYDSIFIGLTLPDQDLKERIHSRLIKRLEGGMIKEVQDLHESGLSWYRMDELGLEYRYLARHLQSLMSKEEMITKLETEIWRYAKRQMTWFKRDKRIVWFEPNDRVAITKFFMTLGLFDNFSV